MTYIFLKNQGLRTSHWEVHYLGPFHSDPPAGFTDDFITFNKYSIFDFNFLFYSSKCNTIDKIKILHNYCYNLIKRKYNYLQLKKKMRVSTCPNGLRIDFVSKLLVLKITTPKHKWIVMTVQDVALHSHLPIFVFSYSIFYFFRVTILI